MLKKIFRIILFILLFLPLIAVAHFFVFPQETRCMLIDFADFKKQQNIYFRKDVQANVINQLTEIKSNAEKKVYTFWQDSQHINYKLIYCQSESDYGKYGTESTPAATFIKLDAYVVVPKDMFDVNILAHEISHTVLHRKIGWYKYIFKIPTWFDEGLAMQVDDRDYYSIDSLLKKKANGLALPDVTKLTSRKEFLSGSNEEVMLNYSVAKYVISEWLKKNSLNRFIELFNSSNNFEQSYMNAGANK